MRLLLRSIVLDNSVYFNIVKTYPKSLQELTRRKTERKSVSFKVRRSKTNLLLIFIDYFISGIVGLRLNLSAANPNLKSHLHRGALARFTLHRNLCIMEFYNMLNDGKSKSRTASLL